MLKLAIDFVAQHQIHLLNLQFLGFTLIIVFFGSLLALIEPKLPAFIIQSFRYGKHKFTGPNNPLVSLLEVPKCWFKHFYVTALIVSTFALYLAMRSVSYEIEAPEWVLQILDLMTAGPSQRKVEVDSNLMLMSTLMFFTQCVRRFYETHFLQIFSRGSKINISHYLVGHLHYIGAAMAILSSSAGFVRGTRPVLFDTQYTITQYVSIYMFYIFWVLQYNSNKILAKLRLDEQTGQVKTEKHLMPKGGLFEFVSCPHMFTEIMMYICLLGMMPDSTTWKYVVTWVASNQIMTAIMTHKWYKQTFKDYPKNRRAIIPFIL